MNLVAHANYFQQPGYDKNVSDTSLVLIHNNSKRGHHDQRRLGREGKSGDSIIDVVTKRVGFVERSNSLTASMLTFKPDDYPAFQLGKPRFDQVG